MKIKCPSCGSVLSIPDTAAGKVVKCQCGKSLRAPGQASGQASAPAPTAATAAAASRPVRQAPSGGIDPGIFDELSDGDLQPVKPVSRPGATSNPYHSPSALDGGTGGQQYSGELASLGQRFLGSFVDQLIYMLAIGASIVPLFFVGGGGGQEPSQVMIFGFLGFAAVVSMIPVVINAVMITKSGQSIGKKAAGTRIVKDPSRELPGFSSGVLVRSYVTTALAQFVPFFGLIDILFIFGEERKCLHDKMAGTIVITA